MTGLATTHVEFRVQPSAYRHWRLARKFIFGTDWPGVPGIARNARAVAALGLGEDVLTGVLAGNALAVYRRMANVLQSIDVTP